MAPGDVAVGTSVGEVGLLSLARFAEWQHSEHRNFALALRIDCAYSSLMRLYMASPTALRGLELYGQDPHWGIDFEDMLRYIERAVAWDDAVLVTEQTDQSLYRRCGWRLFEVMEAGETLILT